MRGRTVRKAPRAVFGAHAADRTVWERFSGIQVMASRLEIWATGLFLGATGNFRRTSQEKK